MLVPGGSLRRSPVPSPLTCPSLSLPRAQFIFHIPNNLTTRQLFDIFAAYGERVLEALQSMLRRSVMIYWPCC
jgi:hypothetical protein